MVENIKLACSSCGVDTMRYPDYCCYGPAGSTKLLGGVCPKELGIEEIKRRCKHYPKCETDAWWQAKRLGRWKGCNVETLEDVYLCFGYDPKEE